MQAGLKICLHHRYILILSEKIQYFTQFATFLAVDKRPANLDIFIASNAQWDWVKSSTNLTQKLQLVPMHDKFCKQQSYSCNYILGLQV